ncbi:MAG: HAMP domain-containing protein, partial [Lachnospiraceae bacterium]|nr:HAMP domain-containing protein [Lachnospiraceae bacterium]
MAKEKKAKRSIGQNVNPNSSFLGLSLAKLKHMDVEKKFTFTFMRLLIIMGIAAVAMFVIIAMEFIGMRTMHAQYLESVEQAGEVRFHSVQVQAEVLWAIAEEHQEDKAEHTQLASDNMSEADEHMENLAAVYTDKEDLENLRRLSDEVHNVGRPMITLITEGVADEHEIYQYFEETFEPVMSSYIALVEDISEESVQMADDMWVLARNITVLLIIVAVFVAALAITFLIRAAIMLTASVKQPVTEISAAADEMAKGNLHVDIEYTSDDELGSMANSMRNMSSTLAGIVEDLQDVMSRLGGGDLIHGSRNPDCYIGDFLPVAQEIRKFRASLAGTMGNIKNASTQVNEGATNMSRGAQDLAEGATDQSASVQELTASVTTVVEQTKLLSESVENGARVAREVKASTDEGAEHMAHVIDAMAKITEAS